MRRLLLWCGLPEVLAPRQADDALVGCAFPLVIVTTLVSPLVGLAVLATAVAIPRRRSAADAARREAEVLAAMPLAVELLAIAVRAGATLPEAIKALEGRLAGSCGAAFDAAAHHLWAGALMADVLDLLKGTLGGPVAPLVHVLRAATRDGDPLLASLEVLAADLHAQSRQRSEVAARRLSVQLLLPLVVCVLPAFALLTVAPLAVVSLRSLPRLP